MLWGKDLCFTPWRSLHERSHLSKHQCLTAYDCTVYLIIDLMLLLQGCKVTRKVTQAGALLCWLLYLSAFFCVLYCQLNASFYAYYCWTDSGDCVLDWSVVTYMTLWLANGWWVGADLHWPIILSDFFRRIKRRFIFHDRCTILISVRGRYRYAEMISLLRNFRRIPISF